MPQWLLDLLSVGISEDFFQHCYWNQRYFSKLLLGPEYSGSGTCLACVLPGFNPCQLIGCPEHYYQECFLNAELGAISEHCWCGPKTVNNKNTIKSCYLPLPKPHKDLSGFKISVPGTGVIAGGVFAMHTANPGSIPSIPCSSSSTKRNSLLQSQEWPSEHLWVWPKRKIFQFLFCNKYKAIIVTRELSLNSDVTETLRLLFRSLDFLL